jgi:hypothetical protein
MNSVEKPISAFLDNVHLAPAQVGKSLSLWPLVLNDAFAVPEGPEYVARSTALARGTLRIDEVTGSGDLRQVRASNTGSIATLFLFGEKILGAKQNRVANASFLIGANDEAVLDVSCPEADRCVESCSACIQRNDGAVSLRPYRSLSEWIRGGPFGAGANDVRVLDAPCPDHATPRKHWPRSGQRAASAKTSNRRGFFPESLREPFRPIARQIGFVACIGSRVVGAEAIGRPDVFRSNFDAMLRDYVIDARAESENESREGADGARFEAPEEFLEALAASPAERGPTLGIGDDYRIGSELVAGSALANAGLVHLTALPT